MSQDEDGEKIANYSTVFFEIQAVKGFLKRNKVTYSLCLNRLLA